MMAVAQLVIVNLAPALCHLLWSNILQVLCIVCCVLRAVYCVLELTPQLAMLNVCVSGCHLAGLVVVKDCGRGASANSAVTK